MWTHFCFRVLWDDDMFASQFAAQFRGTDERP
jgi:hypothetical protein